MNNNYAGNITPEDKSQQEIYHIKLNDRPLSNIRNKNIFYTETKPDLKLLESYTIIYSPDPDTAIIRTKTTRFTTTRSKALWNILYNGPKSVTFQYYDYNLNYPASIQNIQKQLSTHNTRVKLIDLTNFYTLIIEPCASGTEQHIPDLNWDNYKDAMRPYLKLLRDTEALNKQLTYKPAPQISQDIIDYINHWAPAYDLDIPAPVNNPSVYNYYPDNIYNQAMLQLYTQLKAYEQYAIDINDSHTICPHCNLPYSVNILELLMPCPHCDHDDLVTQLDLD